ncbi:MAG: sugar phosphate isomerase/epimerase [Firmicutes bacterium]|nr:sugar phosphate isomerase/epimerase [Bacillota bacterium]
MKLSFGIFPNNSYNDMSLTGVATHSWGDKDIEWCVDRVAEYGYKAIDFFFTRFLEFPEKEYERLSRELKGYVASKGLVIPSVGAHFLTLTSRSYIRKGQVELVKKAIDFSHDIGAQTVTAYIPGYYSPQTYMMMSRKEATQIMVDTVKECAEYAGERDLTFSIEPHQESLINLPEPTLDVIDKVGLDNVRVTIDFGGMEIGMRPHMPIEDAFRMLAPYIDHIHAKDITGTIGHWNQVWFGGGMINFRRYADALRSINYDGYVCVEWEGWCKGGPAGCGDLDHMGLADLDRVAIEAREFLAPYFED